MTNTNITNFRKNVYAYVDHAIRYSEPVNITTKAGNAVLISEEEWNSIRETLHLHSVPGLAESILAAKEDSDSEFVPMEDVEW